MSTFKTVQVRVLEDSQSIFGGEPVYRKGDVYPGVIDTSTNVAMVSFQFGNQVIGLETSKDFYFEISGDTIVNPPESIDKFIKSISLNKWVQENVVDKFDIYVIYANEQVSITNNVEGNGGSEYLHHRQSMLAVKHKDKPNDLLTQIRKGSIFYIEDNDNLFEKQELTLEALSYEVLKEIKFIIENDYKHGGQ